MISFEIVQDWYLRGWMTDDDVDQFYQLGAITEEQKNSILGDGEEL